LLGNFAEFTAAGAIGGGMDKSRVQVFKEKEDCLSWIRELSTTQDIKKGSYLLIKGSRGMQLDTLVERLTGEQ